MHVYAVTVHAVCTCLLHLRFPFISRCFGFLQVARDELLDEEEYNDIVDDITEEIETKYGHIQNIAIPRPTSAEDQVGRCCCCYHFQQHICHCCDV